MTCKIDHSDPANIPKALCRVCNPRSGTSLKPREITMPEVTEEQKLRYARKVKRKLRAEVKQIVGEIDTINGRNPSVTAKLEDKLAKAYSELARADVI
jgi:hypothetical protein